ncbi:MAG: tetrahydrofolate dehydrogenase/cyclohydrolase catalytic domain-containing protein [Patescibacteria group bacterium]|nr:tetrahydrofolate dehydrogenase/cyclohydrolase catalytic domain-containing protein [Patescibacteria group bacterium]
MLKIINGTQSAKKLLSQIQRKVTLLKQQGRHLKMAVVLVGEDLASLSFIRKKEESCKKIGIAFELFKFQADIDTLSLCQKIKIIQEDPRLSALVVQLPLPPKVNTRQVLEMIDPRLDVDCLTSHNLGKLASGIYKILPPTPAAILHLIKEYNINLQRKHIVIVGKGELVGKPLGILLTQDQNTLTICTKFTKNLGNYTRQADVLITAVGKPNLINAGMIKDNIIILDAGTSYKGKKLCGDVNYKQVLEKVKMITPVPGGIGPVTVAKLLENIIILNS